MILPVHRRLALAAVLAAGRAAGSEVVVPPAEVPVAHEVDVVVVGGSAGAVAAAVAARQAGASVFLAAPRPYLGDDVAGTLRFGLDSGEVPQAELEKRVFWAAEPAREEAGRRLAFTVRSSVAPWSPRPGGSSLEALADGKWGDSRTEALQFNSDVVLTLDLGAPRRLRSVTVRAYQRAGDNRVASVRAAVSSDGSVWEPGAETRNDTAESEVYAQRSLVLAVPVVGASRYVRLEIGKAAGADRILLAEVLVDSSSAETGAAARVAGAAELPTPNQVKRALDRALLGAQVPFLYGNFPVSLLRDRAGEPAGVVVANTSGRQAVIARVVIDATDDAVVAGWTSAAWREEPVAHPAVRRIVVGGSVRTGDGLRQVEPSPARCIVDNRGRVIPLHEYEIAASPGRDDLARFRETEQRARDLTWSPDSVAGAERVIAVPERAIVARRRWEGGKEPAGLVPIEALRPEGVEWLLVLGGCGDFPRAAAARLLRPLARMQAGRRVGEFAAGLARTRGPLQLAPSDTSAVPVAGETYARFAAAEGNFRAGPRGVTVPATTLPVLGEYQVVVVGGGTGGASAAISAGRAGARTAVLETLETLGGVGTAGLVSLYYHGNPVGFSQEIDAEVDRMGGMLPAKGDALEWKPVVKAEWYRRELRRLDAAIWFGTYALGAVVRGHEVRGVVVATPRGPGVVLADVVVDSTGNAAVAAAAGAACTYTGGDEIAVQGAGLPPLFLDPRYLNTDYTYVDETDILDVWRAFVVAREKYASAYDVGQLIDTRERRRIRGDVELRPADAVLRRVWPDTIAVARSDFDSHGYAVDPLFLLRQPDRTQYEVPLPYRALLPAGWDGLLVTGLGISVHRDALPLVRMQRDIQNQGYAAGHAAALAALTGVAPRRVDLVRLQAHLAEKGVIPSAMVGAQEASPPGRETLRLSVERVTENHRDLAVLLSDPAAALPLLREALAAAPTRRVVSPTRTSSACSATPRRRLNCAGRWPPSPGIRDGTSRAWASTAVPSAAWTASCWPWPGRRIRSRSGSCSTRPAR